jgi:Mg-chelatase subunit ChlD
LDGQPVMAMFRRSPKSTPLRHRQEELIRHEAELREKAEELERMIAKASRTTEDTPRSSRGKGHSKTDQPDKQLHVSIALQDEHYFDKRESTRRPRLLRKARREGRMVFLLLLAALAAAVIWLMNHLHF